MPSTTSMPSDNQKGDQLIPEGTIPTDQGSNDNNNTTSNFVVPPEAVTGDDNLSAIPWNNSGIVPSTPILTNEANTTIGPNTNGTTTTTPPVTNGTANLPTTNGTNPQGSGNTTNINISIAIAVQNIVNQISSRGGTNNVQLQALIQQLITLLVKQGQASNPNIKSVELQSAPINELFANSTRLGQMSG